MSFSFLMLYTLTVFIASIIPGPSMLLALTHGMNYGVRRTVVSALGNVTVTLVQAFISIAGLGTILLASEFIFYTIKWAGAVYLVYIGISLWRSSNKVIIPGEFDIDKKGNSLKKMYLQSALVTAGNPKAIVFFTAVFPQFIDPGTTYLTQSCILLGACAVIAFGCFMIYAIAGQKIVSLFSKTKVVQCLNKVVGGTFIGAGIGLAVSSK